MGSTRVCPPPASGCWSPRTASSCSRPGTATSSCSPTAHDRRCARSRPAGSAPTRPSSTSRSCCTATDRSRPGPRRSSPARSRRSPAPGAGTRSTRPLSTTCWPATRRRFPRSACSSRPYRRRPASRSSSRSLDPDARFELPAHPGATVAWHDLPPSAPPGAALEAAVTTADIDPAARVWVAGEAAGVQRIRKHLFDERGLARSQCTVRGYWKHGRAGSDALD